MLDQETIVHICAFFSRPHVRAGEDMARNWSFEEKNVPVWLPGANLESAGRADKQQSDILKRPSDLPTRLRMNCKRILPE